MIIYILEVKDKFKDWSPARQLGGLLIVYATARDAKEGLMNHKAAVLEGLASTILQRCKTKYRIKKVKI